MLVLCYLVEPIFGVQTEVIVFFGGMEARGHRGGSSGFADIKKRFCACPGAGGDADVQVDQKTHISPLWNVVVDANLRVVPFLPPLPQDWKVRQEHHGGLATLLAHFDQLFVAVHQMSPAKRVAGAGLSEIHSALSP